ncbi:ABC transporter substrate-binding protein [Cutibacterium sp. V970]|uniref:ABC transporter substrate-binding protein n=1 Tax=Cutibacterium sp. V970 TaxID=3446481 RepID=UPI003EE37A9A
MTNCGHQLTVASQPRRIVSLNQGTTEILLSLGLAKRMVGTATWTDPVLPSLAGENAQVKRLAENNASFETVIAQRPDFVTASFAYTLSDSGSGSYEKFDQLKVPAYMSFVECQKASFKSVSSDGRRDVPVTMADIDRDITDLASLTGTQDRGKELVESLNKRMQAVHPLAGDKHVTVAYWFANSESPYVAGGLGAPALISKQLGLSNVYAAQTDEWPQVGWEDFASKNPDVIVLGDLTRKKQTAETAAAKIAFLESNPVTKKMDAVKNKRFIAVPGGDMNPSIRTVDGAEAVAAGLTKLHMAS